MTVGLNYCPKKILRKIFMISKNDPVAEIMALAYDVAGINLAESKRSMVEGRLAKRLRVLDCDMSEYLTRVRKDTKELSEMLDLLTTNHTAWRREPAHFTDFEQRVLPAIIKARKHEARPKLRLWCAAAATGEEPWTIALSLVRIIPEIEKWDIAMLATDISSRALAKAKAGQYDAERISALSTADRELALERVADTADGRYSVKPQLRSLVNFARLNLMDSWPMRGPFDGIFCRNVMIYFDQPTQERLVNRMAKLLVKGGTLYVGHSESLSAINHPLKAIGPATYVA
jgi:chemotaxis protein methyltransferase CheR